MTDATDRLDEWVRGWCASRGTPQPSAVPGGWHVAVGSEGDRERTFVRSADHLAGAAELSVSPPSRIACLHPLDRPAVEAPTGWTAWEPGWFLAGPPPTAADVRLPDGYRAVVHEGETRVVVEIRTLASHGDQLASSGQVGVRSGVAVPDRIETVAAHRRRGLGQGLMAILATAAAERGATTSLIAASDDGRALYESLGWTPIARFPSFARAS